MNNIIEILNLKKKFNISDNQNLILLENLNLKIAKNSITSIIGPSGSGKSSLLNILGLLDSNFTGHYKFDGTIKINGQLAVQAKISSNLVDRLEV